MRETADHFSGHAADYARYRPRYPAELYEIVVSRVARTELAWDCATGNGQAAVALADHFSAVIATDASERQLQHAKPHPRIEYRVATAEQSGLDAASVDLITAATAAHWFDLDAFYAEARRVGRPGTVIALWTYLPNVVVAPAIDQLVDELAFETLASHWDARVFRYARDGYAKLPFPFDELPAPKLGCRQAWSAEDLCAYLRTWSAVKSYQRATNVDPVAAIAPAISVCWGGEPRAVELPLHLRLGRVR